VVSGCTNERAEFRISLTTCAGGRPCPDVQVTVFDGLFDHDFILNESNRAIGPFPTRQSGTLRIVLKIYDDDRETGTVGTLELPLKNDWFWGVDVSFQENNPIDVCFGCFGSKEYELDPVLGYDDNQRLFIVWGGNSIKNPVLY
jgi:hypothetical protein